MPISSTWVDIRFTLPPNTIDGGMPVVSVDDATAAMRRVLAIAAGADARKPYRRCMTGPPPSRWVGTRNASPTIPGSPPPSVSR
ncbi:putative FATTY ACID SYNTHASE FAS domain protein [Mycobacterium xenopi 3993]|nr:putative FATTY ACID SYNTHASE FAS domain protein [Mycobacterium xenopi 3993]